MHDSVLSSGEAARPDGVVDLRSVARIAPHPALLKIVEIREEAEAATHTLLPCCDVDWPREQADPLGCEVPLNPGVQHVGRIEWA